MEEHNHNMDGHDHMHHEEKGLMAFLPLLVIFLALIFITGTRQLFLDQFDPQLLMTTFMGSFFVVFAFFKFINWKEFALLYVGYDVIAKRSKLYAFSYPVIELALGLAYLSSFELFITNIVTVILMTIGSIGVIGVLRASKEIPCACLGGVIKLPMTKVTLVEDVLMGMMALVMLFVV